MNTLIRLDDEMLVDVIGGDALPAMTIGDGYGGDRNLWGFVQLVLKVIQFFRLGGGNIAGPGIPGTKGAVLF